MAVSAACTRSLPSNSLNAIENDAITDAEEEVEWSWHDALRQDSEKRLLTGCT